jgi:hypothetical protein
MSIVRDRVEELLKMLRSPDTDDRDLAFTILDSHVEMEDYAYVKYLQKESKVMELYWSTHAPKASGVGTLYSDDGIDSITYAHILRGIGYNKSLSNDDKLEQVHFILKKMNGNVLSLLHQNGISQIKEIGIKLILNET